jgi:membrane-associated phospholipid phosphatase
MSTAQKWQVEFKRRILQLWFLKASGTAFFLFIFFQLYFAVLRFPSAAPFEMPTIWLDELITFWPPAFYAYASLWVYTALVPALQLSFKELIAYGFGIGAVCVTGLTFFYFLPTKVPFNAVELSTESSLAILRKIDMSGNACPSLHVATAIFTAMCLHRILLTIGSPAWLRSISWVWCTLIVYSTMGIKQHVFWDVAAGLVLGVIWGAIYLQLTKDARSTRA